jgi:undecaprenyl-diphosphatase
MNESADKTAEAKPNVLRIAKKLIIPFFVLLLILSFYFDQGILNFIESVRFVWLNDFMLYITKDGLVLLIILLGAYLLFKRKYEELTLLVITVICSLESAFLLKKIFEIPRPFYTPAFEQMALKLTTGFSFPSMHATFCLAVIPFLHRIIGPRYLRWPVILLLLAIVFSRVYIGLHYMSDVIAGGLLGWSFAEFWLYLDKKMYIGKRLVREFKEKLELRRQVAHALTGIALIFLVQIGVVTAVTLAAALILGLAFVVVLKNYRIPYVSGILEYFEREKDMKIFPGKGPFFFILGSLLALLFFERNIAMASIAIMAVGDAVATIAGHYWGRYKNPFNQLKHLEGTGLAIILSTFAAFTFVPFHLAFVGSIAGIIFESLTLKFVDRVIDDNLLIPVIAGLAMTALS